MKNRCEGGFPGFTFVADIADRAEDTKKDDLKIQDTKSTKDTDWKNEDAENNKDDMTPFQEILDEIDDMIAKSNVDKRESKMCQLMCDKFKAPTLAKAFSQFEGIRKEVALMILQQALPKLTSELRMVSNLKVTNFNNLNKIASYLDALVKTGIAADTQQGIVFLVGNTGVGKSSLANTLKAYIEAPSQKPTSILTGSKKHKHLIETQILEVYKDIQCQQDSRLSIKLVDEPESGPTLVEFVEETDTMKTSRSKNVNIRLVDMGGHQEYYYCCSTLFFSTSF